MADTRRDAVSEKTLKARLSRTIGTGDEDGYGAIFRQEVAHRFRRTDGEDIMFGSFASALGGLVASIVIGLPAGFTLHHYDHPKGDIDPAFVVQEGDASGYQAVEIGGNSYVLFRGDDDLFRLYNVSNRSGEALIYMGNSGDTLEDVAHVIERIEGTVEALSNGEIASGQLPNFYSYENVSEAFNVNGTVYRVPSERVVADTPESYLQELEASLAQWHEAYRQVSENGHALPINASGETETVASGEDTVLGTAFTIGALTTLGCMLFPFGQAGARTMQRASAGRRRKREQLKAPAHKR